jgi:flagellar protein FliO/FliZ
LGGEKLKTIRARSFLTRTRFAVLVTALFVCAGLLGITFPLAAQAADPIAGAETVAPQAAEAPPLTLVPFDESAILFDDPLPSGQVGGGSATFVVVRMVLVLGLAALAIYGVVFFMKRLAKPQESRDPHLKLLARVPLSSDSFAAVVSVGPKAWLVGGGSGGLNLISEIDDTETLETLLLDDARRNAETEMKGFLDFNSLLQRFRGNPARKASMPPRAASMRTAAEGGFFPEKKLSARKPAPKAGKAAGALI